MAVTVGRVTIGEQLLLRLEQAVARTTNRQIVLGPRCRLCQVGSGTSILAGGSIFYHVQEQLNERGLCDSCERSRLYRLAHGIRPDRPDPLFDSRRGRRKVGA